MYLFLSALELGERSRRFYRARLSGNCSPKKKIPCTMISDRYIGCVLPASFVLQPIVPVGHAATTPFWRDTQMYRYLPYYAHSIPRGMILLRTPTFEISVQETSFQRETETHREKHRDTRLVRPFRQDPVHIADECGKSITTRMHLSIDSSTVPKNHPQCPWPLQPPFLHQPHRVHII